MRPGVPLSLILKPVWTGATLWVWGQALLITVLLAALVAKVVLQAAVRSPNRKLLRALNVVIAPLLVVFLAVVLHRFRDLGYE
jgi:L-lactate permease